ncbi:UNVERIFIED_CONTAM: hypothetical protein FKN15_025757 [Acipenser sinensis]
MDNSRLRQESELVVANVNRWIKEQKIASDNLGAKIKEQNKLLAIVSAEKDHLQETKEALESELKNFKAEMEENKVEKERLKLRTFVFFPLLRHNRIILLISKYFLTSFEIVLNYRSKLQNQDKLFNAFRNIVMQDFEGMIGGNEDGIIQKNILSIAVSEEMGE